MKIQLLFDDAVQISAIEEDVDTLVVVFRSMYIFFDENGKFLDEENRFLTKKLPRQL